MQEEALWQWWVQAGTQGVSALAAAGVLVWGVISARGAWRRAEASRLRTERWEFAKVLTAYLSRWPDNAPGPDQKSELLPLAARTGQGARDIAQWAANGVSFINEKRRLAGQAGKDAHWALKTQAEEIIEAWIENPDSLDELNPFVRD